MKERRVDEIKGIQYLVKNGEHWLYNVKNNRTIVSQCPIEDYLNDKVDSENPLFDFIVSPLKFDVFNINLFKLNLSSHKISKCHKFVLHLMKWQFILPLLLLNCVCFYFFNLSNTLSLKDFSISELICIYLIMSLIVLPLHEYSHFAEYYKNFHPQHVTFGFSLRYLSMPVFFIKVPFFKLLETREKKDLILSGVKIQTVVWSIISIFYLFFPSNFLYHLIIVNLVTIVSNLVPFLKLDGYWYLCEVMQIENYTHYFKKMISRKEKFRIDVFTLGIINYGLVFISLINVIKILKQI